MNGRTLPVVATRYAQARAIRLKPCAIAGAVKISLPARGGVREAIDLLESHRGWLAAQVAKWPVAVPFVHGTRLPFDGGELLVDWDEARSLRVLRAGDRLLVGGPAAGVADRVKRWLLREARAALLPETQCLATSVDRTLARVALGDPVGRWGSCNARTGSINYSWRLILAPAWVRQSVVAHEVAHLVHANHGPGFWALVAELDSRAGESKRWLGRHGRGLHLVGR
ncbi:M48 family metallopeptidase [Polymorphobacter multimanifer]|uniref:YgjP-like metallopeptidase domain-containing protein n=1 Tax=Polymorphobacter multimanifer TaxID=1070431 RepID=A0A841L6V3_9SPHN|nr:YgjP-like metallopeptidase domain-containing protein [Polymorphobacter multimanifer]MBB6228150.1 hypothetical protein [Polymorphobacter multimanifer]